MLRASSPTPCAVAGSARSAVPPEEGDEPVDPMDPTPGHRGRLLVHGSFPPGTEAVAAARNVVAAVMAVHVPDLVDVVRLLVSELATNAVLHAGSRFEVGARAGHGRLRLEVTDRSSLVPVRRSPAPEEGSGRGLHIIDALSSGWGVERLDGGKRVWVDLPTG